MQQEQINEKREKKEANKYHKINETKFEIYERGKYEMKWKKSKSLFL